MINRLRLHDLLPDCVAPSNVEISGLAMDSRNVRPGDAFIALPGRNVHGLQFAESACANGAVVILYDAPLPNGYLVPPSALKVAGLRQRLLAMANRLYGHAGQRLCAVGVTGTNGKTSIVQLLVQAWQLCGDAAASIGTLGAGLSDQLRSTGMTTPDMLEMHRILADVLAKNVANIAVEASSHALDQGRLEGVAFRYAVFSNLTRDHLDYHADMQEYGRAKSRLFFFPTLQAAILNLDDPFIANLAHQLPSSLRVIGYSLEGRQNAELRAHAVTMRRNGVQFELEYQHEKQTVSSSLLSRFNVANLLAVAGVLLAQGLDFATVVRLLASVQPVKGRMDCLAPNDQHGLIVVDYAHTPDALEKVLAVLREQTEGRLICVFGCGGMRDRGKRAPMGAIAQAGADTVIVTDDNPRDEDGDAIIAQILAGCVHPESVIVARDRAVAIHQAIGLARPSDTVLIAGKGHETTQITAGQRRSFHDMSVVKAALAVKCNHSEVQR